MSFIIEDFWGPSPRVIRPWERPDPSPIPAVDLFPRWNRMACRVALVRSEVRWRRRAAWRVIVRGDL